MAESGLSARDCSDFPLLDDRSVRIAVRTRNENERLLGELDRALTVSLNDLMLFTACLDWAGVPSVSKLTIPPNPLI